ncbi:unnamed protein product [Adineta ricciae]|uniref:EF-hand domain-containing protein n=1 Tax=Adineta ricciae TaxID=249248 RepID=A0A814K1V4_ADIRI|nr:unnamed protein product [Adineta ricciae]
MEAFEQNDDYPMIFPVDIRKVPKSLEEIVRITKFNKSEIRLLYKGFKQDYIQTLSILVRGSTKEKLQWIFRFYDISDDGKLTKQTFTTILRSIYDLLGSSMFVHQPITDENIEKHSALIFDKLDSHHSGTINLDDFENYCLHDVQLVETIEFLSSNLV